MNFFFLSLLAFTASGLDSPLTKFMGDPQLFVSAFENADKDTIKKMVSMVNDLLKEGEADRVASVKAFNEAKEKNDADKVALSTATNAYNKAASELAKAIASQTYWKGLANSHYWIWHAAKRALHLANSRHASAVAHFKSTQQRVAEEKKALEDAKSLMEETKSGGRRLLSATEADPKAVDRVIKEIDALIAAGKKEESDALSYLQHMAAVKAKAEKAENAAATQYKNTVKALNSATALVNKNTAIFNEKKEILAGATATEKASASTLKAATVWMNLEVKRVAEEKKTLLEVRDLLERML